MLIKINQLFSNFFVPKYEYIFISIDEGTNVILSGELSEEDYINIYAITFKDISLMNIKGIVITPGFLSHTSYIHTLHQNYIYIQYKLSNHTSELLFKLPQKVYYYNNSFEYVILN